MVNLTEHQKVDYLRRSFFAVDGLWFMKIEEAYGFDIALDTDDAVWKILPKIQARLMKSFTNLKKGLRNLRECLETKLNIEGYKVTIVDTDHDGSFTLHISECPWHELMMKSNREHLAPQVGNRICPTEYSVWAAEFGDWIQCEFYSKLCEKSDICSIRFSGHQD